MIAIKGMNMPSTCAECLFGFYDERISDEEERWVCELSPTKRLFDPEIKRQDWCPLIEAESRWIPCVERLPESGQKVLCACRAGIYDVFTYLKNERGPWYKDDRHVYMMGFVTHWMPLPEPHKEPYKEEKDGY